MSTPQSSASYKMHAAKNLNITAYHVYVYLACLLALQQGSRAAATTAVLQQLICD
jgi:hypothetical protein